MAKGTDTMVGIPGENSEELQLAIIYISRMQTITVHLFANVGNT